MGVDLDRSLSDDESSDDNIDAAAHRCAGALPRGFATVAEGEDDGGYSSDAASAFLTSRSDRIIWNSKF